MRSVHILRRAAMLGASVALAALLVAPSGVAAGTAPITFRMYLFDSCISGYAPTNSTLNFAWRAADGTLKAKGSLSIGAGRSWEYCSSDPAIWVAIGDRIKVTDGGYTRNFTVPKLTMAVDRAGRTAYGTGPAGRTVKICSTWALFGDFEQCTRFRVRQNGTWSYSRSHGWYGGVGVRLTWKSPNGDMLNVSTGVPRLAVTLGKAGFQGTTAPRTAVEVAVNGRSIGQATGDSYGDFKGTFVNARGRKVKIAAGDRVTAASVASDVDFIVPAITGAADRVTDIITGSCPDTGTSDGWARLTVMHSGHFRGGGIAYFEADGTFTVDMRNDPGGLYSPTNIIANDHITIACMQTTGDAAQLKFTVH